MAEVTIGTVAYCTLQTWPKLFEVGRVRDGSPTARRQPAD